MPCTKWSKTELKKAGYYVADAEQHIRGTMFSADLLGFIDILAVGDLEFVGVQTTSADNFTSRRKKILGLNSAIRWLIAGGRIFLHGWKEDQSLRKQEITLENYSQEQIQKARLEQDFSYQRNAKLKKVK